MNPFEKISKAREDGTLVPKVRAKAQDAWPVHVVTDGNVRTGQDQVKLLKSLRRRYRKTLTRGVEVGGPGDSVDTIWICWLQGLDQAPAIVKACVNSCRQANPSKHVVVLTERDLCDYVELPGYLMDKRAAGMILPAHFSDLLRIELLCQRGGLWADATVLFTDEVPGYVWQGPLFAFKQLDLLHRGERPTICSSWFLHSDGTSKVLQLARELLREYWKGSVFLENYFLFHMCLALAAERYPEEWAAIPTFENHAPHVMGFELDAPFSDRRWEQLLGMSAVHKLNRYDDFSGDRGSLYNHILEAYG